MYCYQQMKMIGHDYPSCNGVSLGAQELYRLYDHARNFGSFQYAGAVARIDNFLEPELTSAAEFDAVYVVGL